MAFRDRRTPVPLARLPYSTTKYLDYLFGGSTFRGGLFAGYAQDPSRVGRSFMKFTVPQLSGSDLCWAGSVNACYLKSFGDGTTTVGAEAVDWAWTAATLRWTTSPGMNPNMAWYRQNCTQTSGVGAEGWKQWDLSCEIAAAATGGVLRPEVPRQPVRHLLGARRAIRFCGVRPYAPPRYFLSGWISQSGKHRRTSAKPAGDISVVSTCNSRLHDGEQPAPLRPGLPRPVRAGGRRRRLPPTVEGEHAQGEALRGDGERGVRQQTAGPGGAVHRSQTGDLLLAVDESRGVLRDEHERVAPTPLYGRRKVAGRQGGDGGPGGGEEIVARRTQTGAEGSGEGEGEVGGVGHGAQDPGEGAGAAGVAQVHALGFGVGPVSSRRQAGVLHRILRERGGEDSGAATGNAGPLPPPRRSQL
jgi:hypothetical protein